MWNLYDQLSPEHKFDEALSQYNRTLLQFLYNRDIREVSAIEQFLNPSLSFLSPITKLTNIKKIVDLIENSISSGKRIYIHGDYDVDGMSAVAILWKYLHNVRKANVMPYIPDRVEEGYGLSESSLSFIYDKGVDLIITVDCGIRDHDIIEKWKDKNIDFIVTDHHQLPEVLPDCPIVHPELSKDKVFSGISGATVAWLLVCAMEYFSNKDEFSYTNVAGVDLVGISILSDVM
ncbi:MAG TPA: DHH family phosphoesterase, partial [Candidatus Dojkabacteria bacterium]|nr:DHH family phosphoesterase [Candidatus Dojkabacteria bacterium]